MGCACPGGKFSFEMAAFSAGPVVDFVGEEEMLDGTGFLGSEARPGGKKSIRQNNFYKKALKNKINIILKYNHNYLERGLPITENTSSISIGKNIHFCRTAIPELAVVNAKTTQEMLAKDKINSYPSGRR